MKARIQAAARAGAIPPSEQEKFNNQVMDFNCWLANHTQSRIEPEASLEDVARMSRYDWSDADFGASPGFEFKLIASHDEKSALVSGLESRSPDDEPMPWKMWLNNHQSLEEGCMLIAVYKSGDENPAGFICWNSAVFIDSLDDDATSFDGQRHSLTVELELDSVYVVADLRGVGFGSALRWAVVEHTMDTIVKIAEIPEEKMREIGNPGLRIYYTGGAYSTEGALVASSISEGISTFLEMGRGLDAPWFGDVEVEDDFDYDIYLDRACSLPDPVARVA